VFTSSWSKPELGPIASPLPRPPPGSEAKALSTEPSKLKNDPVWLDIENHGYFEMVPYSRLNTFADTFEGFMPIVDHEYNAVCKAHRYFGKLISRSMWLYYCMHHLYGRLIAISRLEGSATSEEKRYADSI
jgi:hypothetical protein